MADETNQQTPAQPETQTQAETTALTAQTTYQVPEHVGEAVVLSEGQKAITAAPSPTIEQQITDGQQAEAALETRVESLEKQESEKLTYPPEVEARFTAIEALLEKHVALLEKHGIRAIE